MILGRNRDRFELGKYGAAGGAVCTGCKNPFSRSVLAPNLVVGKLGRCPHCGKWAIVRRASSVELDEAEARWVEEQEQGKREVLDENERMRRMLEESKYEDG